MSDEVMPGPEQGYCEMLDAHLIAKDATKKQDFYPLRPSSAGKCTRELAYGLADYMGIAKYAQEEMSPDTQRLLNLGHSVEYNILNMFNDIECLEVRYKQQVLSFFQVSNDRWIEGSIDAVFFSPGHKAVIDIKSKGNKYSSWAKSQWDESDEKYAGLSSVVKVSDSFFWIKDLKAFLDEVNDPFFSANFLQLNLYANSEFLQQRGVDHASIIQYCKNDSRIREFRFTPCPRVYEEVKNKFQLVDMLVTEEKDPTLAPKDYALGSIKCAFCNYKKYCWPTDDSLKAYFATWPKKVWPDDADEILEMQYSLFKNANQEANKAEQFELELIKLLDEKQISKVRFRDGAIYELRFLKSPRPHMTIRRVKL